MSSTSTKPSLGFWMALLTIGGLVAIILIPTIGPTRSEILEMKRRMAPIVQFSSITKAYISDIYLKEGVGTFVAKPSDTAHNVAVVLAQAGLNDASLWIIRDDHQLRGIVIPQTVLTGDPTEGKINPDFAKLTLAWEFAANIPANVANPTTMPIAWTRGLRDDGTWAPDSPWEGKGGHVAYLDGHVEWVDGRLSTAPGGSSFVNYATHQPTVNIHEALPPGAVILSAEPHGAQR